MSDRDTTMSPEDRLLLTASPHLKSPDSTPKIMWNVVGSLAPIVFVAIYYFGPSAIAVMLASIGGAVGVEAILGKKKSLWLHICGYTDPIMEDLVSLGVDLIEFDEPSSLKNAVEVSQKRVAIAGNLATSLFVEGTREQIEQAVKDCIETAAEGSGYILSSGCLVPATSPPENIRYFMEAAVKYGTYH